MPSNHVWTRFVPKEFRTPGHTVHRNNVYRIEKGRQRLVGQLEAGTSTQVSQEQFERLFGGTTALKALDVAGDVASVLNLGVSVVGFLHVSRLLRRIEDRIELVEQRLDEIAELLGVVDQKIDQLIGITDEQTKVLVQLHELVLSFETSKVHAALERLEIRSDMPHSRNRDQHIVADSQVLQEYRTWLAEQRASTPMKAMPARAELLRAEVALVLAETRARCIADDVHFAGSTLQLALTSAREEVERMYEELSHEHMGALVTSPLFEIRDIVEAVSWLKEISLIDASEQLILRLGMTLIQTKMEAGLAETQLKVSLEESEIKRMTFAAGLWLDPKQETLDEAIAQILEDDSDTVDDDNLGDAMDEEHLQADVASFITSYRLSRNLESAISLVAAMEVLGSPVRELLFDGGVPNSPALLVERSVGDDNADHREALSVASPRASIGIAGGGSQDIVE